MVHTLHKINHLNSCNFDTFVALLHNVNEIGTLCAASIWKSRPFKNVNHLFDKISEFLDELPVAAKEGTLRLHSSVLQRLIDDDKELHGNEFMAVSVGFFSQEDKKKIKELDQKYEEKFQFPYVICVRHLNNDDFIHKLEERLKNNFEDEVRESLNELKKITYLRLAALIEHDVLDLKL